MSEEKIPVCSPAIFNRARERKDIEQSPLIHVTTVSEDWATGTGGVVPGFAERAAVDTIQMAFEAVR